MKSNLFKKFRNTCNLILNYYGDISKQNQGAWIMIVFELTEEFLACNKVVCLNVDVRLKYLFTSRQSYSQNIVRLRLRQRRVRSKRISSFAIITFPK